MQKSSSVTGICTSFDNKDTQQGENWLRSIQNCNLVHFANVVVATTFRQEAAASPAKLQSAFTECECHYQTFLHDVRYCLILTSLAFISWGEAPFMNTGSALYLTSAADSNSGAREMETGRWSDSMVTYKCFVDHKSRMPGFFPLCCKVNRA